MGKDSMSLRGQSSFRFSRDHKDSMTRSKSDLALFHRRKDFFHCRPDIIARNKILIPHLYLLFLVPLIGNIHLADKKKRKRKSTFSFRRELLLILKTGGTPLFRSK